MHHFSSHIEVSFDIPQKQAPQRAAHVAPPQPHSLVLCCRGGATRAARCSARFCAAVVVQHETKKRPRSLFVKHLNLFL